MRKILFSFRTILFAGIILLVLTVITLGIFFIAESSKTRIKNSENNFAKALYEYDLLAREVPGLQRDFNRLSQDLDRLEGMIISADSWMSLLKRRRALWLDYSPLIDNYRQSLEKALAAFPANPSITALACEILIKDKAITPDAQAMLRNYIRAFTSVTYNDILLSIHVLLGDFRNPRRAEAVSSFVFSDGSENISVNLILLKMLRGDLLGASQDINAMFYTLAPSQEGLRFIAEYYYDFGDLEESARIFNMIDDEKAMSRESDALYLAGFTGSARNLWNLLSRADPLAQRRGDAEDAGNLFIEKSLYNLGVTSDNEDEAKTYYERLIDLNYTDTISDFKQYGLIRYSRLLDTEEALKILNSFLPPASYLLPSTSPYIDLEIIKRRLSEWQLARQFAEAWILIDRHNEDMDMQRWVSWLFLYQRNFSELSILLDRMDRSNTEENWVLTARAIELMFLGDLEKAQNVFLNILNDDSPSFADWTVYANLGRILEAQRRYQPAVQQYELAAALNHNNESRAKIQVRMSRCYTVLNRPHEARRALEYALELDPGSLAVRLELERL